MICLGRAIESIADPRGRIELYIEPRDLWVGVFVQRGGPVYVIFIPMLVIRISRGRRIL